MKTKEKRKEKILDSLFRHCSVITNTASDVLQKLLIDLNTYPPSETKDQALEVVGAYKRTRTQLEASVEQLHNILYPPPVEAPKEEISDPDNWETF